jgi:hypothetical protein
MLTTKCLVQNRVLFSILLVTAREFGEDQFDEVLGRLQLMF